LAKGILQKKWKLMPRLSFLDSQGIILHNLSPQISLNPHFPPPYADGGVVPTSGQCKPPARSSLYMLTS
jgi:hypothetical protein